MTPTTRRHPRTMGEAFKGAEYASAIHHVTPERRAGHRLASVTLAIAIGAALALVLVYGPGGL